MQPQDFEPEPTASTNMNEIQTDWDQNDLHARLNKIEQDLQLLKPLLQHIHSTRTLILDAFACNLSPDLGQLENNKENINPVAQGGHVIADIQIIKDQHDIEAEGPDPETDPESAARWEQVFEDLYTVPFKYAEEILSADKELIHTLNFHADLLVLPEWQGHDSWEMYKGWVDIVIADWLNWVDGGKVSECPFVEGSSTLKVVSWLRGAWWEGVSIGARNLPFSN